MEKSRTEYVKKNIFFGYIGTIISSIVLMVCRTVFVYKLGEEYLGVSGLFSNVLGVLSFTELGIGSAITFSLYKPIAENDNEKIKSLLQLFKKAYRIVALIVASVGICLIPFLSYLVKTSIPLAQIRIYYCIFLFNTVVSYLVTYKTSYVSALQKEYIITNINTVGTIITSIIQILILLAGGDYLSYLLIVTFVEFLQRIVTVLYINKKFPIVAEKNIKPLDERTKFDIWRNVKALIIHKIGDVSVHQTDNIIVSAFVSTSAVGLLSSYTTIQGLISAFTDRFFGSFTASFGNLIAKENVDKRKSIYDTFDLLGFWINGFVLISFVTLSQPFITLWLGERLLVDNLTMFLFFFSEYLAGMSFVPYSFNVAAGKFNEDKWVAFVQAIVNLVVSIVAVKIFGLPGIYVGTIVSRLIVCISKPYVVYKYVLEDNVLKYFFRLLKRTSLVIVICVVLWNLKNAILSTVTIFSFAIMCIITAIIPNLIFFVLYKNTESFKDILSRINIGKK